MILGSFAAPHYYYYAAWGKILMRIYVEHKLFSQSRGAGTEAASH
jgi:hypothetical protein